MSYVKGKDIKTVSIAQVATPGTVVLVAAPGGKASIRVIAISYSTPAAGTIQLQTSTGGTVALTGAQNFAANGGIAIAGGVIEPVLHVPEGCNLELVSSGAGAGANGFITYYIER